MADDLDIQVTLHTDTLNESGFVESTIAAFAGRTIHAFHTEGAGGGHAPDIIRVAGLAEAMIAISVIGLALAGLGHGFAHGLEAPGGGACVGFVMGFLTTADALQLMGRALPLRRVVCHKGH